MASLITLLTLTQEKVNRKAAQINATKQQIDKVVKKMKDEGMWSIPSFPTERVIRP